MKVKPLFVFGTVIVSGLSTVYTARAQEDIFTLEEIVVTAQKREQSLQDVPASVQAFSDDMLHRMGINNVADAVQYAVGVSQVNELDSDHKFNLTTARGVFPGFASAGQDPAVGFYVDEIYMGNGVAQNISLFDVERVEFLRGPQGTLFGRNTIGGVVNITTKKPTDEAGGYIELEAARFGRKTVKLGYGGAIAEDKLVGSFSVLYDETDGFYNNTLLNRNANDTRQHAVHTAVTWTPADNAEIFFSADYRNLRGHNKYREVQAVGEGLNAAYIFSRFLNPELDLIGDSTDFDIRSDVISETDLESYGGAINARIRLSGFDLVSISGYRTHDHFDLGDTDGLELDLAVDGDPESVRRFTQEVRFESPAENKIRWLTGLYYVNQYTDHQSFVTVGQDLVTAFDFFNTVLAPAAGLPPVAVPVAGETSRAKGKSDMRSYAVFGNVEIPVTEQLDLLFGARWTLESRDIDYQQVDAALALGGSFTGNGKKDWEQWTPSMTLRYRWNQDVMTYLTISQGFKSGGFNDTFGNANSATAFNPETLWSYELGLKSSWLQDRLRFNAAIYRMDWSDIQIQLDNPDTPAFDLLTQNAGEAHSQGVEIELTAMLTPNWRVNTSYSYIDEAQFDEGDIPLIDPTTGLPSSKPLTEIPGSLRYEFMLGSEYVLALGDGYEGRFNVFYRRKGSQFLDFETDTEFAKEPAYELVDARFTLASLSKNWEISIYGKNLTNEIYRVRMFDFRDNPFIGSVVQYLGQPRSYGAQVRYQF